MTESSSRCLHCGAVILLGVRFCPECGRPTTSRSGNPLPWIVGALLGLALILFLIILLLRRPNGPPVVAAPVAAPSGPPVVAAPVRVPSGPPVVSAPPRAAIPKVPEDPNRAAVAFYLSKMAKIEAQRKTIVNGLLPGMITLAVLQKMGGMEDMLQQLDENNEGDQKQQPTQSTSQQQAQATIDGYRQQLSGIIASAQRVQAPLPAASFHNSYLYAVRSYDAAIAQVETALIQKDATIGTKMGNLSGNVTQPLAGSDAELEKLLDRYKLPRTFKVDDKLEGSLTGAELSP